MCGRYYIDDDIDEEELQKIFDELNKKFNLKPDEDESTKMSGEIYPTNIVPIIANNKSMAPTPFFMKWGYTPSWDPKQLLINARSETASTSKTFKEGMLNRRCIIPASHYFEWQKTDGGKIKHAIKPNGSKAMYMAGIYRLEQDKPVFTILTREPAPGIAFIHNRMPVILPKEAHKDWLNIEYNADEVIKAAMLDMEYKTA